MSRTILFKAKRIDTGEWVWGYYTFSFNSHKIIHLSTNDINGEHPLGYEVDPSTICQYTGLKDKNGKEIFEGDRVKYYDENIHVIVWHSELCFFGAHHKESDLYYKLNQHLYEITGSIHDKNNQ